MNRKSGFTLIELLVVITIIAILAGAVYFIASSATSSARDSKRKQDLETLRNALELWATKKNEEPEDLGKNYFEVVPSSAVGCALTNKGPCAHSELGFLVDPTLAGGSPDEQAYIDKLPQPPPGAFKQDGNPATSYYYRSIGSGFYRFVTYLENNDPNNSDRGTCQAENAWELFTGGGGRSGPDPIPYCP